MDEEEKRLLEGYKRLSPKSRYVVLAQITAGVEMLEIARRIAAGELVDDSGYIMPGSDPVMGALKEMADEF